MIIREGKSAGKHLCSRCWILKAAEHFNRSNYQDCGRRSECKECQRKDWKKKIQSGEQAIYKRKYRLKNKDTINAKRREERRILRKTDPLYVIEDVFRNRIRGAIKLKNATKAYKSMDMLGCSILDFKIYLEARFESGMSWENYGKEWHIDHIIPVSLFDLIKPEHQKRCFHFSNMQPMWKLDNHRKGNKLFYEEGFLHL